MKYRVSFTGREKSFHIDVSADSMDKAGKIGHRYADERGLYYQGYDNMTVSEIPQGISTIGIEFEYKDYVFKRDFRECIFIRAESEKQALDYYNEHFKGKRFSHQNTIGKVDSNGKCEYGRARNTYFACVGGYNVDATI